MHIIMTASTKKLIDILNEMDNVLVDNGNNKVMEENKTMCRLMNIHFKEFYDDIYIPYKYFRDDDWKIGKILYNNEDILFYNKKYLPEADEERFYEVFDKFTTMIEGILTPNNNLYNFLKKWTNMTGKKWKSTNQTSYLKKILDDPDYQYISPAYIVDMYCGLVNKYGNNSSQILEQLTNILESILSQANDEVKKFRKKYNKIVSSYVFECPHMLSTKDKYDSGLINSVLLEIFNFAEKLIDLHIHGVHTIVNSIINFYTPLDDINTYIPGNHHMRKLYIV